MIPYLEPLRPSGETRSEGKLKKLVKRPPVPLRTPSRSDGVLGQIDYTARDMYSVRINTHTSASAIDAFGYMYTGFRGVFRRQDFRIISVTKAGLLPGGRG